MAKPTKATLAERAKAVGLDIDLNDTVDQLVEQVEAAEAAAKAPPAPPAPGAEEAAAKAKADAEAEEAAATAKADAEAEDDEDDEAPLAPYTVADGKSVSCLAGIVGPGEAIELKDLNTDSAQAAACLKTLVKRKIVKKN